MKIQFFTVLTIIVCGSANLWSQKCDQVKLGCDGTCVLQIFPDNQNRAVAGTLRQSSADESLWELDNGVICRLRIIESADGVDCTLTCSLRDRQSDAVKLLRSEVRKTLPPTMNTFWDGFEVRTLSSARPLSRKKLMETFPLACVYGSQAGFALGISADSITGSLNSLVSTDNRQIRLSYGTRMVVDNRREQKIGFTAFAFNPEFGWCNAVEEYYAKYPQYFQPTPGVDSRIYGVGGYLGYAHGYAGFELHPRRYDRMSWEWAYAPWVMAGDWYPEEQDGNEKIYTEEITSRGQAGTLLKPGEKCSWRKYHDFSKEYFQSSERAVAPLYYLLVKNINGKVISKFPDSGFRDAAGNLGSNKDSGSITADLGHCGWAFAYGSGLQAYLERKIRLAVENYQISGFSFDMANYSINDYGPAQLKYATARNFDEDGKIYTGDFALPIFFADYIHTLKRDGKTMAVYMNLAMNGAVGFTAFHADGLMYEGCPGDCTGQVLVERLMSGRKPMNFWGFPDNCFGDNFSQYSAVNWAKLKNHPQAREEIRQGMAQFLLFSSLRYGITMQTWSSTHPVIHPWLDVITALQKAGWHPTTAVKGAGSDLLWIGRFGNGPETIITITNPERVPVKAELTLLNSYLGNAGYLLVPECGQPLKQQLRNGKTSFALELPPKGIVVMRTMEITGRLAGNFETVQTANGDIIIKTPTTFPAFKLSGRFYDFRHRLMAVSTAAGKPQRVSRENDCFTVKIPADAAEIIVKACPQIVLSNPADALLACFRYSAVADPNTRPLLVLPEKAVREELIARDMFALYYPTNVCSLTKFGHRNTTDVNQFDPAYLTKWPFQTLTPQAASGHRGWKIYIGRQDAFPQLAAKFTTKEKEQLEFAAEGMVKLFPNEKILWIGGRDAAGVIAAAQCCFSILDQTKLNVKP